MVEVARIGVDGETGSGLRRGRGIVRPADGGGDVDRGNQFGIGRRQFGLRPHAGFHRQVCGFAAGGQHGREQDGKRQVQGWLHVRRLRQSDGDAADAADAATG
jgi:hypothetical protein